MAVLDANWLSLTEYKKRVERKITMQTQTQNVQTQTVDRLGRTAQNHWVAPLRRADHESDHAAFGHFFREYFSVAESWAVGSRLIVEIARGVWAWLGKVQTAGFFLANFWRARSRLSQNEILQENMRLTAFFKLYKICILLHRCNLKIFAKIGLKNQQFL